MRSKHFFDDLKKIGKRKYYFRNGEEEWCFSNKDLIIDICKRDDYLIDLVITYNNIRSNYINSACLNYNQKMQLHSVIHSYNSIEAKCKSICQILLDIFLK